ncbi:MAG: c-type cytochrome [Rhodoferax sp.]|nr:c-type cytochrome [Rhodoferax sp.]
MSAVRLHFSRPSLALLWCGLLLSGSGGSNAALAKTAQEKGRDIYNYRCYFCHGYSGNSRTLAATYLQPRPTDFTGLSSTTSVESVVSVLKSGRPGTAMKSFLGILDEAEMAWVAGFVVQEFVKDRAPNTQYHTKENGWPDHERHKSAFPFVTGEIPVSQAWESLSTVQSQGKRLYLATCVTCHDRGVSSQDVYGHQELTFEREKGGSTSRGAARHDPANQK